MNSTRRWILTIAALALVGLAAPAAAGDGTPTVIIGEVVEVRNGAPGTDNPEWDEVTVRTSSGEQARLRLGPSGEGQGPYQVGDMVRARVMAGGASEEGAYLVRNMRNRRTGTKARYRTSQGDLVQNRAQLRQQAGDGSCDGAAQQTRTRARDGSGTGAARGASGGGGRGTGGGGGRR